MSENSKRIDLSAIAVDLLPEAGRLFGRNSEDFLEKVHKRNRRRSVAELIDSSIAVRA
jgi:hypothetical protein